MVGKINSNFGLVVIVNRMEFDKTRWCCSWDCDQNCAKDSVRGWLRLWGLGGLEGLEVEVLKGLGVGGSNGCLI